MEYQQVQEMSTTIKFLSFGAIGIGIVLAMYYLAALKRFITLWDQSLQNGKEQKTRKAAEIVTGINLNTIKIVLKKENTSLGGDVEKSRLEARKRLLVFIVYFGLIVIVSVLGSIIIAIAVAR